ncbi:anti-sigma factor [Phenylobacterium immobile]|uniref:anti-sigma factor n=1 Tax=Phenylobacterium immobile TaxID=21 RepID=UPI000AC50FCB|nr:anti-sigma factor [Phenylobacterium immobile]
MSEGPELSGDEALAAEHALGVLTDAERAAVEARAVQEPAFAALIEAWRKRLAPILATVPSLAAPETLWPAVERRLPANEDRRSDDRRRRGAVVFWRTATIGALMATAASLALTVQVVNRPPVVMVQGQPTPGPLMSASLAAPAGGALFVAAYDPERKGLLVTSLVPPGTDPDHVHQLWVIPGDGKPRPIGFIAPGASAMVPMAQDMQPMMTAGSAIAVSVEPLGGSKQEGPSGPIAAVGKLASV